MASARAPGEPANPRMAHLPMVLETEKDPDGAQDRMNLATLRGLLTAE